SFEPTGDSDTLATKSLVVTWSQRRQQQRSRLALKCAQEQDSVQASRPKVSKATQTLSYLPGSQNQRASQSCQQNEEYQTTQIPTAGQACEQTHEEGLSLTQGAADFSTAGALKDTVLLLNNTLQTFLEALHAAGPPNQPTANLAQGAADFPAAGILKDTVLLLNYTLQTSVEALIFCWASMGSFLKYDSATSTSRTTVPPSTTTTITATATTTAATSLVPTSPATITTRART
ncbi:unnamed protein product, partial [Polarella glacialis]